MWSRERYHDALTHTSRYTGIARTELGLGRSQLSVDLSAHWSEEYVRAKERGIHSLQHLILAATRASSTCAGGSWLRLGLGCRAGTVHDTLRARRECVFLRKLCIELGFHQHSSVSTSTRPRSFTRTAKPSPSPKRLDSGSVLSPSLVLHLRAPEPPSYRPPRRQPSPHQDAC
jgi:hypothetical protein